MEETILTGCLGTEPEIRATRTGKMVANFNLAVSAGKSANGEPVTHWYRCEAWEKTAEIVRQYLHKGSRVLVRGVPRAEGYTSKKDGQAHATLCLTVRTLEMLGSKAESGQAAETREETARSEQGGYTAVEEDELPF